MKPIGPLMWEHRLIEQMVPLMKKEIEQIGKNHIANVYFISIAVDFSGPTPTGPTTERRRTSSLANCQRKSWRKSTRGSWMNSSRSIAWRERR